MKPMHQHYDVVVVGSGFAGSVSAATLSAGGARVLLVERGPWRDTEPVRNAGIQDRSPLPYGRHFYTHLLHRVGNAQTAGNGWCLNRRGLFDLHLGKDMSIICANGVGGGSHVYSAMNVRPERADYWDGHTVEIRAADMEPHYAWMIGKMGARAPTAADRIPNATTTRFAHDRHFVADDSVAQPAMSMRMQGNADDYRSNSFFGSANGAKATLDRVLLLPAMADGMEIAALHECIAVWKREGGGYVLGLMDHTEGHHRYVRADKVVLAAGTLNTLRLLFRSREQGGLNGMPALGLGFGGNGDMPAYWALNETGADFSTGTPCHGRFALRDPVTGAAMNGPNLTSYGLNGIADIPLPGFLRRRLMRDLVLVGMGADKADGVVEWRKGKLQCRYLRQNSPVLAAINAGFDEVARRSGKPVWYSERFLFTVHPLGGARLSASCDTGVVNSHGEVHGHPGLFVADAAALPAAPGTAPSMTISAWSRHVAHRLLASGLPAPAARSARQHTTSSNPSEAST